MLGSLCCNFAVLAALGDRSVPVQRASPYLRSVCLVTARGTSSLKDTAAVLFSFPFLTAGGKAWQ